MGSQMEGTFLSSDLSAYFFINPKKGSYLAICQNVAIAS
jgi:hypothetical protein